MKNKEVIENVINQLSNLNVEPEVVIEKVGVQLSYIGLLFLSFFAAASMALSSFLVWWAGLIMFCFGIVSLAYGLQNRSEIEV